MPWWPKRCHRGRGGERLGTAPSRVVQVGSVFSGRSATRMWTGNIALRSVTVPSAALTALTPLPAATTAARPVFDGTNPGPRQLPVISMRPKAALWVGTLPGTAATVTAGVVDSGSCGPSTGPSRVGLREGAERHPGPPAAAEHRGERPEDTDGNRLDVDSDRRAATAGKTQAGAIAVAEADPPSPQR